MSNGTTVIKRNGNKESLDLNKLHLMVEEACKDKTVYITEGPFDSTFIPNSIAMCGADADVSSFNFSGIVWIYDNEPRNAEIIERLSKAIDSGEKVVIWPSSIEQKDINDLVLAGLNPMDMRVS